MTDLTSAQADLSGTIRQDWGRGGIVDMALDAHQPLSAWQVTVDLGGEITNIWNARVLGREGTRYTLGPLDYNSAVAAGESINFGVQVNGGIAFDPLALRVAEGAADLANDAAPAPVPAAPAPPPADSLQAVPVPPTPGPPPLPQTAAGTAPAIPVSPSGGGLGPDAERLSQQSLTYADQPEDPFGGIFVEGDTVLEPSGTRAGLPADDFAPGPFSVRGAAIVDSAGAAAQIHGINWFGLESDIFTPHGLWARNWRELMDEAKSLGFNTLRVPFSGELVARNGGTPSGIDYALNPDLEGLNGLQILDAVVGYADRIGLRVLLDYHRGNTGDGPNDNGLWYGDGRSEADVIAEWRAMAERYKDAPAVIGADLMNEPHAATWGDGSDTDWAAAAERIGNAVLSIAPDWLIVVEGISTYDENTYWWGGNLEGVRDHPVVLDVPGRVVYSPHDYPASVHPQDWFTDGSNLTAVFRQHWGYLVEEGIAPVLLGEWGSRLIGELDLDWADALSAYLKTHDIPWFWWSLNPNSGDTGGVLEDDWTTVRTAVTSLLDPFLSETRPEISFGEMANFDDNAVFTVRLAAPAPEGVELKFATTDGTAVAGSDYVATAGSLLFAPGELEKTVSVPVLPDPDAEGDEFFYLFVDGPGALSGSGTSIITDDEQRTQNSVPFVDVAGSVAGAAAGVAQFRVILSEAAAKDVRLGFITGPEGSGPAGMARADLIIPAGAREATVEVAMAPGATALGPARYTLELTSAENAVVRSASAVGLIAAERPSAAQVMVAGHSADSAALTVDLVLENDWGSGALFNVVIKNVSDAPVEGWQLSMDLPFDLSELWSAVLVSDEGDRVTVKSAVWNAAIAPGQAVDFGFITDDGGIALSEMLSRADVELAIQ
ncbi:cellulase family glycosylhydrolase [Acuticoccus sp. MNP-M23]|uniref:cellulase family glycosylhydrolase n=1 Tax=Acuticoccus sp. MNP-M23 TaxID=3072793 RepID=UPI0028164D52|nr:cellulase family glycosylhydrolase [Acuticoccus sp. MNP-M23]WMS41780.1 cellulase family glycosylhydrolase [Acuticoccus sp. MNP-M23]